MKYGSSNTISSILDIPQRKVINLGGFTCDQMAKQMNVWMPKAGAVNPDNEAIRFYSLNQAVALIEQQYGKTSVLPELPLQIVREYQKVLVAQVHRLLVYTMLVTTRESRHLHAMPENWWSGMVGKYGLNFKSFNEQVHGKNSSTAVDLFKEHPPQLGVGPYSRGLAALFNTGKFSSSYGGKPWGNIAHTMAECLNGSTSSEVFVDTAYTLAHNNGPMFNKGMLYTMYSAELAKILDIQRAGRVIEYILESKKGHEYAPMFAKLKSLLPDKIADYVDYYDVEAKGALKMYPQEKNQQVSKHGEPASALENKKKLQAEQAAAEAKKKLEEASKFEVWPGTFVKVVKRAA